MKGWKVLSVDRRSCRASFWYLGCIGPNIWTVQYPRNIEVFPEVEGTKLFFFKNYEQAEGFASSAEIVVPCIAKGVTKTKWIGSRIYTIDSFWKNRSKANKENKKKAPEGTYLAKSITCLE